MQKELSIWLDLQLSNKRNSIQKLVLLIMVTHHQKLVEDSAFHYLLKSISCHTYKRNSSVALDNRYVCFRRLCKKHQMGTQGFKLFLAVRDMHSVPTFSHHCKNLQIGDNFEFCSNWHLINIGPKQSWSHYINFDFIAISTTSPHQLLIS